MSEDCPAFIYSSSKMGMLVIFTRSASTLYPANPHAIIFPTLFARPRHPDSYSARSTTLHRTPLPTPMHSTFRRSCSDVRNRYFLMVSCKRKSGAHLATECAPLSSKAPVGETTAGQSMLLCKG